MNMMNAIEKSIGDGSIVNESSEYTGSSTYPEKSDSIDADEMCKPKTVDDMDNFPLLTMLRDVFRREGNGNFIVAWRRHFDTNGDGVLNFGEFCQSLTALHYEGDVLDLWKEVDTDQSNRISLDEIDADSADVLIFFKKFCKSFGGPVELFTAIDDDGSDSLTKEEFGYGLEKLGWFEHPQCPECCDTVEEILDILFPALDLDGQGCVTPEELLFLEPDMKKKKLLEKQFTREREKKIGAVKNERPVSRRQAAKFLSALYKRSTTQGNVHWTKWAEVLDSPKRSLVEGIIDAPELQLRDGILKNNKDGSFEPPKWSSSLEDELNRCDALSVNGTSKQLRENIRNALKETWKSEVVLKPLKKGNLFPDKKWAKQASIPVRNLTKLSKPEKANKDAKNMLKLVYHHAVQRVLKDPTRECIPDIDKQIEAKGGMVPRKNRWDRNIYHKPPIVLPKLKGARFPKDRPREREIRCVYDVFRPQELYLHYGPTGV